MMSEAEALEQLAELFLHRDATGQWVHRSDKDLVNASLIMIHVIGCKVFGLVQSGALSLNQAETAVATLGVTLHQAILDATGVDLKEAVKR